MVSLKSINIVLEGIIGKCSNSEVREKLSNLSVDEKKEKLKGKLNPFEEHDYDNVLRDYTFWSEIRDGELKDNVDNPYSLKELNKLEDELFNYEKRIFRGYDLDKNRDKVPSYNIDDFHEERSRGENDDGEEIYELEQSQLDYQEEHMFIDDEHLLDDNEANALRAYFGNESAYINSELSSKYKGGLWNNLPDDVRKEQSASNRKRIPFIDSAMSKAPGLKENTVLYHGVQDSHLVDIHSRVGDTVRLSSYISASFDKTVGQGYGATIGNSKPLFVRFLSPTGTRGIGANDNNVKLTNWKKEHEYLLDRGQSGKIVDIDYTEGMVTVLLDE